MCCEEFVIFFANLANMVHVRENHSTYLHISKKLDKLTNGDNPLFVKSKGGIYHDDGLAIIDIGTFQAHTVKTRLEEIFRAEGLKIKVNANLKVTEFLDVKLNLETGDPL